MLLFLILIHLLPSESSEIALQRRNYCSLQGTVFVEKDKNRADFLVYVEASDAFATLIVYREENRLFADRPGLWHFTGNRSMANFTVFFVKEKHLAHFSISYTDSPTFAGCN